MMYVTFLCSYLRTAIVSSGIPYRLSIFQSSFRLIESYASLTRSKNSRWDSCWCSHIVSSADFCVNVASAKPFPKSEPHCSSIPNFARCVVSQLARIDDVVFAQISPNAMPLHLFGFDKSPLVGKMQSLSLVNSVGSYWGLFQYSKIVSSNSW